jgi:hypothetical protein
MANQEPSAPKHLGHLIDGGPIFGDVDVETVEAREILIALNDQQLWVGVAIVRHKSG